MSDIVFGGPLAIDLFSLANNWYPQSSDNEQKSDRETGKNAEGDVIATAIFNLMNNASVPFECFESTGNLYLPKLGIVSGGFMLQTLALGLTNRRWPVLTLQGHNHGANAHVNGGLPEFTSYFASAGSNPIPAGRGCAGIASLFPRADALSDIIAATYNFTCGHDDVEGNVGNHAAGSNADGQETLTLNLLGTPNWSAGALDDWDLISSRAGTSNDPGGFDTTVIQLARNVVRDA